ncbi:hypothetical protein OC845_001932 [Tilletia horrida]|nr:hypothetical protein OC845_001932 [Tilletia horrida]
MGRRPDPKPTATAAARQSQPKPTSEKNGPSDEVTIRYLQAHREAIPAEAQRLDDGRTHSSGAAIVLGAAYQELEINRYLLEYADTLDEQDNRYLEPLPDVTPPFDIGTRLATIQKAASTQDALAAKAPPRAQIEKAISDGVWTPRDANKLRQVVLAECKSVTAHRLLRTHTKPDVLATVASMTDEDLSRASLPEHLSSYESDSRDYRGYGSRKGESVDWVLVSRMVGSRHSPDDCRTHWLMCVRPGVNDSEWKSDEIARLVELVSQAQSRGERPVRWENIAKSLSTNRTGFACLSMYRRQTAGSESAAWEPGDVAEALDVLSVYGPQWSQAASELSQPILPTVLRSKFLYMRKG